MIACLDVHYAETSALAAGLLIRDWKSNTTVDEAVKSIESISPYQAGNFYLRELPCLLDLLMTSRAFLENNPGLFVIDGYVHLGTDRHEGLGAHLHRAIRRPVIGVAKTRFFGTTAVQVCRGTSTSPLYVTAIGIDEALAAEHVLTMYGPHRIPAALRRVDRLSRGEPVRHECTFDLCA